MLAYQWGYKDYPWRNPLHSINNIEFSTIDKKDREIFKENGKLGYLEFLRKKSHQDNKANEIGIPILIKKTRVRMAT